MANPIDMNTLLNDLENDLKKSLNAQVAGMPDSLDDAIDSAQMSRKLGLQNISPTISTTGNFVWNGTVPSITDTNMSRQNWLKETEHNRLIALTEAIKLVTEKANIDGQLYETVAHNITKVAGIFAEFLNEGKIK